MPENQANNEPHIIVNDLTMAYGTFVVQRDLTFTVNRGDIFIIMGGSGCGKSTLLRHMIGLQAPAKGTVNYGDVSFWEVEPAGRERLMRRFGILYQSGALFSSMTLAENIALPLQEYTDLDAGKIGKLVSLKLALVGLAGFEEYYPSEISGGMQKRAGLARAMALDPEILFFDEPSAGLDPVTSAELDRLILQLRDALNMSIVIITHELESAFNVADRITILDQGRQIMTGTRDEIRNSDDKRIVNMLGRRVRDDAIDAEAYLNELTRGRIR